MFIFGILAFGNGLCGLIKPELLLIAFGFQVTPAAQRAAGDYTLAFTTAAAMASFNMGIYYVLAAHNNLKPFYRWTVPFRTVTFIVFTSLVIAERAPTRFLAVAVWEALGALCTGIALYREKKIINTNSNE